MIADTTGRIGLIQDLDAYGRGGKQMTATQIQQEAPAYDSVWGAFFPQTWLGSNPGIVLSRYYMPFEDEALISGHNLAWFQQNHPEWILYGCDNNNNPTQDYAWSGTGFADDVPLDIHNPAVVAYQMTTLKNFLTQNGYKALAIDNAVFENFLVSPNQVLEGKSVQKGWYGCGIYQNGQFVRRYNGPFDNTNDATFNGDLLNWVAQARANLGPLGIKIIVNHPPLGFSPDANEQAMIGYLDGMLDENGFTHYGQPLGQTAVANTLNWMNLLQGRHVAFFVVDNWCLNGVAPGGVPCPSDPSQMPSWEIDFSLAGYALGNNGGADVTISPNGGAQPSFLPQYRTTRYGSPCGSFTQSGAVFTREFSGGFAVLNTNPNGSAQVNLPSHSYSDVEGRAISNPLTVGASDGYLLIRTNGSGCP